MTTHTFKINAPVNCRNGSVEIDGRPIEGVVRVAFEINPKAPTVLTLEIMGHVIVEGEFRESALVSVRQANPNQSG